MPWPILRRPADIIWIRSPGLGVYQNRRLPTCAVSLCRFPNLYSGGTAGAFDPFPLFQTPYRTKGSLSLSSVDQLKTLYYYRFDEVPERDDLY